MDRATRLVKLLPTVAQLYEKSHVKSVHYVHDLENHSRSSEVPLFDRQQSRPISDLK